MNKTEEDEGFTPIQFLIVFILVLLLIGNALGLVFGLSSGAYRLCSKQIRRIETITPTYRLGCWLMKQNGE